MFEYLFPAYSFPLVHDQTLLNKIFSVFPYLCVIREGQSPIQNVVFIRLKRSAGPGGVPKDHFVQNNTDTPDVRLGCVGLLRQKLRSHIKRCTAAITQLFGSLNVCLGNKPEIRYFVRVALCESVFRFQIPMYIPFVDQRLNSLHNLSHRHYRVHFGQLPTVLVHLLPQVSVTEIHDHVRVILPVMEVVELYYIGLPLDFLHDIDLVLQGVYQEHVLIEDSHVHLLDCNVLVCFLVEHLVDYPVRPCAYLDLSCPVILGEGELICHSLVLYFIARYQFFECRYDSRHVSISEVGHLRGGNSRLWGALKIPAGNKSYFEFITLAYNYLIQMSSLVTQFIIFEEQRAKILASGVALLSGYFFNYIITFLVDIFGFCSVSRPDAGRRLRDQVTRHMWVFGVGCMFSLCGIPGLHGTYHAILAWIAWLALMVMHVMFLIPCEDTYGRWRIISTGIFYIVCVVWYIGIVAYFFSNSKGL